MEKDQKRTQESKKPWEEMVRAVSKFLRPA